MLKFLCTLLQKKVKFDFDAPCFMKQRLVEAPILMDLNCDASDTTVGPVLGHHKDKIFHFIYYASKTLDIVQCHYIMIEKELMALVFTFDKFHPCLIGTKVTVFTDYVALRYLFNKKAAKPRLI